MEASDNQINTFNGHGPGGRVVACTKKPALRPACLVDQTPKISNLLEDLKKVERFAQYIENQTSGNMTETDGSQKQYAFMEDNRYI